MPHVNNVNFSESKFALMFQPPYKQLWEARIILLCLCDQIVFLPKFSKFQNVHVWTKNEIWL